ncbi:uncharacterized protein METZ01_LOCUS482652, partial [marine metagenome]
VQNRTIAIQRLLTTDKHLITNDNRLSKR